MSSSNNSPKPKSKRFRGLFRSTFGRSSSQLAPSSPSSQLLEPQTSLSPKLPNDALTMVDRPIEQSTSSAGVQQPAAIQSTSQSVLVSPTIGSGIANPQPGPPSTPPSPIVADTVTNAAWSGMRKSLQTLRDTSGIFGPLASAAGLLLECFDTIETAARNQEDYEGLATELASLVEAVTQHFQASTSTAMSKCISSVVIGIKHQGLAIKEKQSRGAGRRLLPAKEEEEDIVRSYRKIQSLFRQLQANLGLSTWSAVHASSVNERLKGLNPKLEAAYDSTLSTSVGRRTCTEGTRQEVISNLTKWLHNPIAPTMYWMNGMAGTGKTTIAYTFAERLEQDKRLAASFFCTRTSADCRDATRIIPTVAYQLARYSIPFQSALYDALMEDPDTGSKNIPKQFERLLKAPLQRVKDTMPANVVVVVDALDECDDHDEVESLLDTLFKHAPSSPIKFLVTSRPEPEIYKRMTVYAQSHEAVHLHDLESSLVQGDIALYLQEELASMSLKPTQIDQLARQSGSLFIYAATLVRYIRSGERRSDPHKRLQWVLTMTPEATQRHVQIDALYTAILKTALDGNVMEQEEMEDIRVVLRTVLLAQEPIGIETIAALAGIEKPQEVLSALQPLRSVLRQSEETGLVSALHASFPDFMFDNKRSGSYFCDIVEHSQLLAQRCFTVMKGQLRFNICDLESSFVSDDEVEGIQARIKDKISPTLAYVCRHWASHLALAPRLDDLLEMLREFLCDRLLFWMEVLSLRRVVVVGIDVLLTAKQWLMSGAVSSEIVLLLEDARNFVTSYASSSAPRSTPHIYISSLPFCPHSSLVYKHYWKRMCGLLELKGSIMEGRETAALAFWNVGASVWKVAYSPDGSRVAAGCDDGTLSIRNANDGTLLVGPLQAKFSGSVAFSPDGEFVACGCRDKTIRVWNVHNGTPVGAPFEGHTQKVQSVSFSPDGACIVSGSEDSTIRVWAVIDGTLVLGPLEGHSGRVHSVAFSPNGTLIASASVDDTIRIWNTHDGTPAASPFSCQTSSAISVAFTPNSTQLVSGSWDKKIRVWNISDGSLVTSSFKSRTDSVNSMAVSPDGTRVASGSYNGTIRVWKSEDGTLVAGPFVGYTGSIHSVAFSPDGTRVIANSGEGIRMWNVREGIFPPTLSTLVDALDGIESVSFSPDGSSVLSSSSDSTIRIWDISDGSFTTSSHKAKFFSSPLSHSSPNGTYIASASEVGKVQIINKADGSLAAGPFEIYYNSLSIFQFTHDGTAAIMGCKDGTIRFQPLFSGQSEAILLPGHRQEIKSITQSHGCSLLVSYSYSYSRLHNDTSMRVWDMSSPPIDITSYSKPSPSATSDRSCSSAHDGWHFKEDGWVVHNNRLLFWLPNDIASLWQSSYASLIITESGILQIPKQRLLIGEQWYRCYVEDQLQYNDNAQL